MKDFLPLKKQPLPNHVERNFFKACKLSAAEHGYTGFMASFRFLYRRYMDYFWQMLAFRAIPYSKLRVKVHRWREVKIGKNIMIGPQVIYRRRISKLRRNRRRSVACCQRLYSNPQ